MVGKTTAVLMEMLPFESVEVMGIRTATGVVGEVVAGDGESVMMMLSDAGAGEFAVSGSKLGDGTRKLGAGVSPPTNEVISVG